MSEPSLSVVCHECGNHYSLHVATVCPECFTWPVRRLQFTGENCIQILLWTGCQHWNNDMLHSTDNPYVYVGGVPVLMEKGDWAVKDDKGQFHVEKAAEAGVEAGSR